MGRHPEGLSAISLGLISAEGPGGGGRDGEVKEVLDALEEAGALDHLEGLGLA
ncbi:MAG: hypothetical protein R2695_10400 [Acidimicrobiales bacterium]